MTGALGLWALMYVGVCAVAVWRHCRAPKAPKYYPAVPPRALVMRPCKGVTPDLQQALMSGVCLRAAAPQRLVHLVEAEDEARPVAARTAQMLQTLGIAAKVQLTSPTGINHKASQLAACDAYTKHYGVSICIDADVVLNQDTLAALCAPLADPACGAAWLPFVQAGDAQSFGDRINGAILATSLQAFGILRHLDEAHFVGKLVAIRPAALEQVGGWQAVEHLLGEDTVLSQKLVAKGWRVRCGQALGYTPAQARSTRKVIARYARWAMVLRRHRSLVFWTYPFVICPMPLLCLGLSAAAMRDGRMLWGLAAVLLARLSISFVGCRGSEKRFHAAAELIDAMTADSYLFVAFIAACFSRHLVWRGRRFVFGRTHHKIRIE